MTVNLELKLWEILSRTQTVDGIYVTGTSSTVTRLVLWREVIGVGLIVRQNSNDGEGRKSGLSSKIWVGDRFLCKSYVNFQKVIPMQILSKIPVYVCMYVCMYSTALITATVLCTRSQDSVLSVSARRVHAVFLTAGFQDGEKPCRKTRETTALRRGIHEVLRRMYPNSNPNHWCTSSQIFNHWATWALGDRFSCKSGFGTENGHLSSESVN